MNKILILLFILINQIAMAKKPIEIKTIKPVFSLIETLLETKSKKEILLVFDIDNTLLSTNQELGSFRWGLWQKDMIKNHGRNAVVQSMRELYSLETVLLTLSNMHPTEQETPRYLNWTNQQGISSIALTSRGPQMRSVTEREFKKNKYFLNSFSKGFPYEYFPPNEGSRKVSFQNGIYMTAGQNKGVMLQNLLRKTNSKFTTIIFVDDTLKHSIDMVDSYKNLNIDVYAFRYGFMDSKLKEFKLSNKEKVIDQWKSLKKTLDSIFK